MSVDGINYNCSLSLIVDIAFMSKVLLGERHGCKVDNVVPTRAGLRTVLNVLKIQMNFWPTLEPVFLNILSKWGVHVQERSEYNYLW